MAVPAPTYRKLTEEEQNKVLQLFAERCEHLRIKSETETFFKEQAVFIAGVSSALLTLGVETPPYWSICAMTNRSLINSKTKQDGI